MTFGASLNSDDLAIELGGVLFNVAVLYTPTEDPIVIWPGAMRSDYSIGGELSNLTVQAAEIATVFLEDRDWVDIEGEALEALEWLSALCSRINYDLEQVARINIECLKEKRVIA